MTATTDTQAPATRGEALAADLLDRESITYNDRYLYPTMWTTALKDAFRSVAQRLADDGIRDRWNGHEYFGTYDSVDRYLERAFTGTALAGLTTGYPQVLGRWYYAALESVRNMTFPEAEALEEIPAEAPAPVVSPHPGWTDITQSCPPALNREVFTEGTRWLFVNEHTMANTSRTGQEVVVRNERFGNNWGTGVNEYLSVQFPDGDTMLVYLRDLRPLAPTDPKDAEIARLTAEVTRLTEMVEAARTALHATEIVF